MNNYLIILFFLLQFFSYRQAAEIRLDGEWNSEKFLENKDIPYSEFSIKLQINDENYVIGEICSITRYGNKIDCPINFESKLDNNQIELKFNSNFGGINGIGLISFDGCKLNWQLIKHPYGDSYLELEASLFPERININKSIISCNH